MPTLTSTQTRSANNAPLYVPTDGAGDAFVSGGLTVAGTSFLQGPVFAQAITAASVSTTGPINSGGNLTVGTLAVPASLGVFGPLSTLGNVTVGSPASPASLSVSSGTVTQGSVTTSTVQTTTTAVTFPESGGNQPVPGLPARIKTGGIVEVWLFDSSNPNSAVSSGYYMATISTFGGPTGNINATVITNSFAAGGSSVAVVDNNDTIANGLGFIIAVPAYSVAFQGTCIVKYTLSSVP